MLAIIGGTGLTRLSTLAVTHREVIRTPFGEPSAALVFGELAGGRAIFLARHGHGHTIPPHRVNYRANLWALKDQGASAVLAVASVGGIRDCHPGDLVLPHQLIDYTSGRAQTFFDGGDQQVVHADFTHPYSQRLRQLCLAGARELGVDYASVCVVVNHAAGRGDSAVEVSMDRIANVLEDAMDKVRALVQQVVALVPSQPRAHPPDAAEIEPEVAADDP